MNELAYPSSQYQQTSSTYHDSSASSTQNQKSRTSEPGKLESKTKESSEKPPKKTSTAEGRREYQRKYYQMHKEKAKEYQRQYNLTHKKKAKLPGGRGKKKNVEVREVVRATYNEEDIQWATPEEVEKRVRQILRGERLFTIQTEEPSHQRGQLPVERIPKKERFPTGAGHMNITNNPNPTIEDRV